MNVDRISQALQPYLENYYWRPLLILAASLIAAVAVDLFFRRLVLRLTRKTSTDLDDRLVRLLHRPIFTTMILVGLTWITAGLALPDPYGRVVQRTLHTLILLIWILVLIRVSSLLLEALSAIQDRAKFVDPQTLQLFDNLAKVFLVGAGIYFFLSIWGIETAAWLTSAGVIGIAVGFAARDTLANLFSGVFILTDKPYKIGDFVNLDSGERGMVTHIGLRTSRLLTRDDIEITIPNAVIAQAKIINETGGHWNKERIRVAVGVAYGSDIDQVQEILLDIANGHEEVCASPAPRVRFRAFGDSSLDFELLCWVDQPVLRGRVLHELHCEVYRRFQSEGVQIPFPQRDVHLYTASPSSAAGGSSSPPDGDDGP